MKKCKICQKEFTTNYPQKIYCDNQCRINGNKQIKKTKNDNRRNGLKQKLVKMFGGQCSICGYKKCMAVLSFHHIDPTTKLFTVNVGHLSLTNWKSVVKEAQKCKLVCANCHYELHHPNLCV